MARKEINWILIIPVMLGCILAKSIEWFFQLNVTNIITFEQWYNMFFPYQISVLVIITIPLFIAYQYLGLGKGKMLFTIPASYYFVKEFYNQLIYPYVIGGVPNFTFGFVQVMALIIEPLTIGLGSGLVVFYLWKKAFGE